MPEVCKVNGGLDHIQKRPETRPSHLKFTVASRTLGVCCANLMSTPGSFMERCEERQEFRQNRRGMGTCVFSSQGEQSDSWRIQIWSARAAECLVSATPPGTRFSYTTEPVKVFIRLLPNVECRRESCHIVGNACSRSCRGDFYGTQSSF